MARGWDLRAAQRRFARAAAGPLGQEPVPERGHRRLPVGKDEWGWWRTEGIRRQQEGSGRKRHLLVDTEGLVIKAKVRSASVPDQDGLSLLLQSARSGLSCLKHLWLDAGYEGRGKRWAEDVMGLSVQIVRKPLSPYRGGVCEAVGRRVGQGGQEGRLAEADAAARVRGPASQVGGRANLLVALSEQEDEQRLRAAVRQRGSVRLRGHDTSDGEQVGSCLRISKQFLHVVG
jgi:transposase